MVGEVRSFDKFGDDETGKVVCAANIINLHDVRMIEFRDVASFGKVCSIFFVLLGPVLGWGIDAGGYAPSFGLAALVYVIAAIAIACPLLRAMRP